MRADRSSIYCEPKNAETHVSCRTATNRKPRLLYRSRNHFAGFALSRGKREHSFPSLEGSETTRKLFGSRRQITGRSDSRLACGRGGGRLKAKSERPPAIPAADGLPKTIEIYEVDSTTNHCLCGQDFRPGSAFVITENPVVTVSRVCGACSTTLSSGSFAERGELARLLLTHAKGSER